MVCSESLHFLLGKASKRTRESLFHNEASYFSGREDFNLLSRFIPEGRIIDLLHGSRYDVRNLPMIKL